jgi:DNA-binding SARP family transcriptional activator
MRQMVPTGPLQRQSALMNRLHSVTTLHLFGEFRLSAGETGETLGMTIDMPRVQSLLAYLVLHRHAPQSRTKLAYTFWPDSTESQAHTNLRNLLHKVRKVLPNVDSVLYMNRHTIQWRSDANWTLDVLDFEAAIARADKAKQAEDHFAQRLALEQAVRVYGGDLLPGCYDEWILPERNRLSQLFLDVLERLALLLEEEGDYARAISTAQRLLRHDPLHEATYRHLMRMYAASGNRAAVARTYQNCSAILEQELAVGPSAATREVYRQLLQAESRSDQSPAAHPSQVSQERQLQAHQAECGKRQLQIRYRSPLGGVRRAPCRTIVMLKPVSISLVNTGNPCDRSCRARRNEKAQ